jgi:hypothetical protein
LDAGELKQIQEWRALGGKELAQQTLEGNQKRKEMPTITQTPPPYVPQSPEEKLVESVFDLLTRVLRHF